MEEKNKSRRNFINYLLGGGFTLVASSVIYPIVRFMLPPKSTEAEPMAVSAGKVGEMHLNSGKIFKFGRKPGLLIYTKQGEYRAFMATCSHLDCIVQFRDDSESIWCACHNGYYDVNGNNVSGPPPRPLENLDVIIKDDDIMVSKIT